jgi:hypothetical protein
LTPHLAAISSWAYSYVIGGYFFLSKNKEPRIFLLLSLRFWRILSWETAYRCQTPWDSERPRAVWSRTQDDHCDEAPPVKRNNYWKL